jgi:hypothetical protein
VFGRRRACVEPNAVKLSDPRAEDGDLWRIRVAGLMVGFPLDYFIANPGSFDDAWIAAMTSGR